MKGFGNMYRIIDFIKNIPKKIKWFIQRGSRGYADCDIYDLDYWFEKTFIPMLKELKKRKIRISL